MDPLIIVSGHPRSGTSMMMRMLHMGGLTIIADPEPWPGDPGNIYGTFETMNYEWIMDNQEQTQGCVVKVASQFGNILKGMIDDAKVPPKIIFMERPMKDILASLKRVKNTWKPHPSVAINISLKIINHYQLPMLTVPYLHVLKNPRLMSEKVQSFIGKDLDVDQMVAAVDPSICHFGLK